VDQVERQIIEIDNSQAKAAQKEVEQGWKKVESSADRAAKKIGQGVDQTAQDMMRVVNTSQRSINALASRVEQRAAAQMRNPAERLAAERRVDIGRAGGDAAAIERINRAYDRMHQTLRQTDAVEKHAAAMERGARSTRQAAEANQRFISSAGEMGRVLTYSVTIPMGVAATAGLVLSERYESARTAFTRFLGTAEKAETFLAQLEAFAQRTPFEFTDLVTAAQRLQALGFRASEVIPTLTAVGDAVAAMGGSKEMIDRITLALGQMQTKGKVSGEEIRQLAEAGVPAWEALAKRVGKTIPETMKMAEKGALSASVAIPAILESMMQRSGGLMATQNKRLAGQFSNLRDQAGFLLRDVGAMLTPLALKMVGFAQSSVGAIRDLVGGFRTLPQPVQTATLAVLGFVALAGPFAAAASGMSRAMVLLSGLGVAGGAGGGLAALRALPGTLRNITLFATGVPLALTAAEMKLMLLGKAALFVAAAFVGWKIGRWISDTFRLGDAAEEAANKLTKAAEAQEEFAAEKMFESLKKRGLLMERNGQTAQEWAAQLRSAFRQVEAFEAMGKRSQATGTETVEKRMQAEKRTLEILEQAQRKEMDGLSRIIIEHRQYQRELRLSALANERLNQAVLIRLKTEAESQMRTNSRDVLRSVEEEGAARREHFGRIFQIEQEFSSETNDLNLRNLTDRLALEETVYQDSRDRRLRSLDAEQSRTVSQKIDAESRRARIEEEYALKSFSLRMALLDREADREQELAYQVAIARGLSEQDAAARRDAIGRSYAGKAQEVELQTQNKIDEIRERAATRQRDIVIQRNEQVFDSLKRQSEGVIDALITRTNSLGDAIKNIFRATLLTPIKDALSSRIAAFLTGRVTGNPITLQSSGSLGSRQGGLSGGLGTLLDAIGVGRVPVSQGQGGFGGTPPFLPQRQAAGVGGLGFGNGLGIIGIGGMGANPMGFPGGRIDALRDFFGLGSSIGTGAGSATTFGAASFGQKLSALGKSDAAGMAGIGLGLAGWNRGGWSGAAMMGGGGALLGYKIGGPLGAGIGAAAGFGLGAIRQLFFKGPEQKIVEKVQQVYGLKVDKQFARMALWPIIQQEFGGNVDLGVRSARVRELLSVYGQQTNQNRLSAIDSMPRDLLLTQSAGRVMQAPTMVNGVGYNYGGSTAGAGQRFAPNPNISISLQLDGQASTAVFRGETVQLMQEQPGIVAGAVRRSVVGSSGGRQAAVSFADPLAVI